MLIHRLTKWFKKVAPPTPLAVVIVLFASLMAGANEAGYFARDWAPPAIVLALLFLVVSVVGWLRVKRSWWSALAVALLDAYTSGTFVSLSWSPNKGSAWLGAGQTLLYMLAFSIMVGLIASGASRRWILLASTLGPATVALFTLLELTPRAQYLFENNRLFGSVQYYNGEAAFLLIPFWTAVYLAGSRRVHPFFRGMVLAGVVLSVSVAVLTQSRGAMVAMALSLPVFFLFSGQRLRGFLALAPIAIILYITFPGLNDVYLAFRNEEDPTAVLGRVSLIAWFAAGAAGLYGLLWGFVDQRWKPPVGVVRMVGSVVLACAIVALVVGGLAFSDRVGNPVTWGEQKWEAFKNNDVSGQDQSRYLSVSGSGRYTLWQVAWKDFVAQPIRGVGTQNYEATYYQLREQPSPPYVRQPHSLPLEVLGERGIIGGVLFFGFLITCAVAGLNQRFRKLNAEGKAQVGAATAAVAYWLVHSSAEWFWQLPAVTLPAMAYLAVLVAPWNRIRAATAPTRWPLRVVGVALAVVAIASIMPLYLADLYLQRSYTTKDTAAALQSIERAQRFNPVDPRLPQREAELALQLQDEDWARAEEAYRRAIRLDPEHYVPYYLLALVNDRLGEDEQAKALYEKALSLNPLGDQVQRRGKQEGSERTANRPSPSAAGGAQ